MATAKWTAYNGIQTALSTGLDSLANAGEAVSAAIANGTNLDFYMDLVFNLASVDLSAQTNPSVSIWVINEVDGSNYEDGGAGSVIPARTPDAIIPLRAVNAAQVVARRMVLIPPGNFKILLQNNAGAALSTGNTLEYNTYSEQVV